MGVFWRCFYHIVWATKHRTPVLSNVIEAKVYQLIEQKCDEMNTPIVALGGFVDHIHIAVSIPPRQSISEWVRSIKGYTAFEINAHFSSLSERFQWQSGYGVLTFGEKQIPFVTAYVQNQKIHHANNTLYSALEDVGEDES